MSANPCCILAMVTVLYTPSVMISYSLGYHNLLTKCFNVKKGWAEGTEENFNNAVLGGSLVLGLTFGALIGGPLMKIGRRRSLIISLIVGILGNVISSFIESIVMINIGRFIFGVGAGLTSSIIPKFLAETIPTHLYGAVVAGFTCFGGIGSLIANFAGG